MGGQWRQAAIADRLPDLPAAMPPMPDVEQQAMASRIDCNDPAAGRGAGEESGPRAARASSTCWNSHHQQRFEREPQQRGYEISFELPLFDWGQTRVVQAESRYRQALERARETAVNGALRMREAYALQQSQYAIARHLRDEVVPLKQRISEETCCATTACDRRFRIAGRRALADCLGPTPPSGAARLLAGRRRFADALWARLAKR